AELSNATIAQLSAQKEGEISQRSIEAETRYSSVTRMAAIIASQASWALGGGASRRRASIGLRQNDLAVWAGAALRDKARRHHPPQRGRRGHQANAAIRQVARLRGKSRRSAGSVARS